MIQYFLVFIICIFSHFALGQEVSVVSHYPETAFVAKRMLPFTVQGASVQKVISVITHGNDSCSTMVDPYYNKIFHIFCREAGSVNLAITVESTDRFDSFVTLNNIRIYNLGVEIEEREVPFAEESEEPF